MLLLIFLLKIKTNDDNDKAYDQNVEYMSITMDVL